MRLAYFSPLPPERSGIADYSEELLPYLASRLELECFVEDPDGAREASTTGLPIHGYEVFRERRAQFDLALYHLGNNPDYHGAIYRQLSRDSGVVVLHEYMLHHLVQGLTLARGAAAEYVEEMRYAYGRSGQRLAERMVDTGLPVDAWRYPLFERVVDRSLGLIVHNDTTRRRVLASRPDTAIERVPHHLALGELPDEATDGVRARFGIPDDALLVASFGFITPQKKPDVTLRAFSELRRVHPTSRYLLAGEVSPHYDLDTLLAQELSEGVVVTGRLPLGEMLALMRACDIAVNLRYPSGGETSGTLMRLLGLGAAVIVSDHGSFAEIPDGCCAKVPIGEGEISVLTRYLKALAENRDLRGRMGENARRHMEAEHTLDGSAEAYVGFLRRIAASERTPFSAAPPLEAEPRSVFGRLMADVGAAIADLGVVDHDAAMLDEVAKAVTRLGLASGGTRKRPA